MDAGKSLMAILNSFTGKVGQPVPTLSKKKIQMDKAVINFSLQDGPKNRLHSFKTIKTILPVAIVI